MHRPLIIFTPKSMLRNKLAVSDPSDFTAGSWQPVLEDPTVTEPSEVTSVLLASGKVRWDLVNRRKAERLDGKVAILAVERLYPLPAQQIAEYLIRCERVKEVRWVQDEPKNQGAWPFIALNLPSALSSAFPGRDWTLTPITRPASSAPSVGSAKVHESQQRALMDQAFAEL
jgi:2-oxoglutarate dehydrogenase E1 component